MHDWGGKEVSFEVLSGGVNVGSLVAISFFASAGCGGRGNCRWFGRVMRCKRQDFRGA